MATSTEPYTADGGPLRPVAGPAVWTAEYLRARDEWLYTLTPDDVAELTGVAHAVDSGGLDLLSIDRDAFPLPGFGVELKAIREHVLRGIGFAQIRGLPVHLLGRRRAALIFWGIAQHLGDEVVSQNARGDLLGHVKDLGQTLADDTSRGPYTRERIEYHCDASDIVGLLCLHPSKSGGESTLASAGQVYNDMLRRRPDLAAALAEPVYRDRRGEIPEGKELWYAIPVFNFAAGELCVSNEPSYIDSVSRFFDSNPNTPAQLKGLALLDALAEELHFDIAFEAGDMQFLNNHTILHSRQAFTDFDEVERKRHLLRIWLLNNDGMPLPPAYLERNGVRDTVRRPGGILAAGTVPHCSLDGL